MRLGLIILCMWVLSCTVLGQDDKAPRMEVDLDRTEIYEGESVIYVVRLLNVLEPTPPDLTGLNDFIVEPAGERSLNSTQMIIINGRRRDLSQYGMEYRFKLTPRKTGTFRIPAPQAEEDGNMLRGKPLTLKVTGPGNQDIAFLEIETKPGSVYPLQPFTVTLKIRIKALPEPNDDQSPLSVQRDPPVLNIPWASQELPEGIQPQEDLQKWLNPMMSRGLGFQRATGFSINDYSSSFSFFSDEPLVFNLKNEKVRRPDETGRTQTYWEYSIARDFTPERSGFYRFGPVTLKGIFAKNRDSRGQLQGEQIFAVGKAVEVAVKDVPSEGKPPSFTGAIGRFDLTA
ncbi:MAG: BatD family protein [Planctomycetes bacterium]|nr:BatD family protein [Planctomycetota bacterium]